MSGGIPRKFSQVLDEAREETEMQQLYDELDSVRAQLVRGCVAVYTRSCPRVVTRGEESFMSGALHTRALLRARNEALLASASLAGL